MNAGDIIPRGRVRFLLLCPILILAATTLRAAPVVLPRHDLVEVDAAAGAGRNMLFAGGYDIIGERAGGRVVILATPAEEDRLRSTGFTVHILLEDFAAHASAARGKGTGFGAFHTYSETTERLDDLHALYPHLTSAKFALGTTAEGRTLWAIKVSDNPDLDESEPELLFTGAHHAREPMSVEACLMLIEYLCANHGSDPRVTQLVDGREIFFVPIVNADGYAFNESVAPNGGGYWRKNRRDNGDGTFGVDLNRNYPYEWGGAGASTDPDSDDYRGPTAASEPETQAMIAFATSRSFSVVQNFHTFRGMTLYPWGYTTDPTTDDSTYRDIAAQMTADNGYTPGQASQILYHTSGDAESWFHGEQLLKGKTFAFSNEIGWGSDLFWPPDDRIPFLFQENLEPALHLIEIAGPSMLLRGHRLTSGSGEDLLNPGDVGYLSLDLQCAGVMSDLQGVQVELLSQDPLVTVSGGVRSLGDLSARELRNLDADPFLVSVDPLKPASSTADFVVRFTWSGGSQDAPLQVSVGAPVVVFSDGFESGAGAWSMGVPWGLTTAASNRGSTSMTDSPAGLYANGAVAVLELAAPIDLTSVPLPYLSFWTKYELERNWDFCTVEASRDGTTWEFVRNVSATNTAWQFWTIPMARYAGEPSVRLRFRLLSDVIAGQFDGWYIDDVAVSGPGPVDARRVGDPASGHYYEVVDAVASWEGARAQAEAMTFRGMRGHLVSISSAAENVFLTNAFGGNRLHYHWIGAMQPAGSAEPTGGWRWTTCEPWSYANPGFASNSFGTEDRVVFDHAVLADGKQWNDLTGTWSTSGFVVEYDQLLPAAAASPSQLAFGDVQVGSVSALEVQIANTGCTGLRVTGFDFGNAAFSTLRAVPFDVASGATESVSVEFRPTTIGAVSAPLAILTNDPAHPVLGITIAGTGVSAPSIAIVPESVTSTLAPGEVGASIVRIENRGGADLHFYVPSIDYYKAVTAAVPLLEVNGAGLAAAQPDKDVMQADPILGTLGDGGPDAYGYRWSDSDDPEGPDFAWVDIATTGTAVLVEGDDVVSAPIPLGFEFPFYGTEYSSIRAGSNGFISFTSTATAYMNLDLPSVSAPPSLLAVFWDDLNLNLPASGDVFSQIVDGRMVVQWNGVARYGTAIPLTFQVILDPWGGIIFQYLSVAAGTLTSATVGIQDATGTTGLSVVANASYLKDNLAIAIRREEEWLTATPAIGIVAPGSHAELALTLDATGMTLGQYSGSITIYSDDGLHPMTVLPVNLIVQDFLADVPSFAGRPVDLLPAVPNPFNPQTVIAMHLSAPGRALLRIFDVRGAVIRTLVDAEMAAGLHEVAWDGTTDGALPAPSGVYLCRLQVAGQELSRRLTLVR